MQEAHPFGSLSAEPATRPSVVEFVNTAAYQWDSFGNGLSPAGLPACASTPHASVPILYLRPDLVQGPLEAAAIEDVEMLVWHGVGVINASDLLDIGETRLEVLLPSSHDDDTFAGVATRPQRK